MPHVFSRQTLEKFEAASASIPIRALDRAFEAVDIRLGKDPGGLDGARRMQFRRYVAGVDQHDPQQVGRLGDALGALIDEVAASKQEFLVKAAERDGFAFTDGVFRPAETAPHSFAVTRVEDLAFIDDRGRRLLLLANDRPKDAIAGAAELVESVCRTVRAFEPVSAAKDDAKKVADLVRTCLQLGRTPRHARLAVGAAVTFAGFIAETYLERTKRQASTH